MKILKKIRILQGYVDCIDHKNKSIWEFKCVSEIDRSYFLQVLMYKYLVDHSDSSLKDYNYYLMNILTNEIYHISVDENTLCELVSFIFMHKYGTPEKSSDSEFLKNCSLISDKYLEKVSQKKITDFFKK